MEFVAEPRGTEQEFRNATSGSASGAATKVIMDAYLAGFAGSERATLVTLDKALSKLGQKTGTVTVLLINCA